MKRDAKYRLRKRNLEKHEQAGKVNFLLIPFFFSPISPFLCSHSVSFTLVQSDCVVRYGVN